MKREGERVPTGPNEWLAIGRDGWLYWYLPYFHDVRVRVTPALGGRRLVISAVALEAYLEGSPAEPVLLPGSGKAISSADLRDLPIGRLEAIINVPENAAEVLDGLTSRRLPDYSPRCPLGRAYERAEALPLRPADGSLVLPIPPGRSHGEDFYAGVASAYSTATVFSDRPIIAVAEANAVPVATVNRWVREARRLGMLAPTRRGHR
jgi:hypothetical protein